MSRANEHHTTLSNGATCQRLSLCANLIHNQHLRHVVLNSLNLFDAARQKSSRSKRQTNSRKMQQLGKRLV